MLDEIKKGIDLNLSGILDKTKAYITNPLAQAILFKPIREQIVDSLDQLQRLIATYYTEDDKKVLKMSKFEEIYAQLDFKSVDSTKKSSE